MDKDLKIGLALSGGGARGFAHLGVLKKLEQEDIGFREVLVASGFGWNAANNWGAALGTAYSTYVEILDGFGESWGFSPSDWYADIAGCLFFAAQNFFPSLQNFTPKFQHYQQNPPQ